MARRFRERDERGRDLYAASFWSLLVLPRSHWPLQNTGCSANWYISIVHNAKPNSDFAAAITCNCDGELPALAFAKWKALCMILHATERRLKSHATIIGPTFLSAGQFEYQKEYNVTYYSCIRHFLFSQTGIYRVRRLRQAPYTKQSVLMALGEYIYIRKCDVAYFSNYFYSYKICVFYTDGVIYWLSRIISNFLTI